MIKWLLFFGFIILSTFSSKAQNCANAGFDTEVCGFSYNLVGSPGPGTWRYICNADSQYVRLAMRSNRTAGVVVSACGIYEFEYTANDSLTECYDKDTVRIQFEDPSTGIIDVDYLFDLEYPIVNCHEANADTCGNIRQIKGKDQPDPFWNIRVTGDCSTTNFIVNVLNENPLDCTASFIDVKSDSKMQELQRLWRSNQDVFVNLENDDDSTFVKNNIFIGFMELLTSSLVNDLKDSCGIVSKCFDLDDSCIDTVFDTTYIRVPVHIGGHWNFIGANGKVDLTKNSLIVVDNQEYQLNVKPNARYYGPDDIYFELLKKNNNGSFSNIDTSVNVDVFWEEDWTFDSVQRVLPRVVVDPSCNNCGMIEEDYGPMIMPAIPSFFCPTLLIKFTPGAKPNIPSDTTLCGNESILLDPGEFDTYLWNDRSMNRFKNVFDTGTYKVVVSVNNGCQDSATIVVNRSELPKVKILSGDTIYCIGDTFSLFANAPDKSTFKWSNGDTSQHAIFKADKTDNYIVEIADSNGCTAMDTIQISAESGVSPVFAGQDTSLNCIVKSLNLNPDSLGLSMVYSFEWSGPSIDSNNHKKYRPLINQEGLYILEVADSAIQCGNRDTIVITLDTVKPIFDFSYSNLELTCQNPTSVLSIANINSRDPYSIIWTKDISDTIAEFENQIVVNDAGHYTVELCNDITGCCNTDTITIESNVEIIVSDAGNDKVLTCDSTEVLIGGINTTKGSDLIYIWNGPTLVDEDTSAQIIVELPGLYILKVLDTLGNCSSIDSVIVTAPGTIPIAALGDDIIITCQNEIDSIVNDNSVIGPSVLIEWSGPSINMSNKNDRHQSNILEGEYIIVLTDTLNGCTSSDTIQVTNTVRIPNIDAGQDKIITCNFPSVTLDGRILNFRPSQKIRWIGPGIDAMNRSTMTPTVNESGLYRFIVRDTANNCLAIDTVEVIELIRSADIDAGPDQSITCDNKSAKIEASISNLRSPGYFEWSGRDVDDTNKNDTSIIVSNGGEYILNTIYPNPKCNKMDTIIIEVDTISPNIDLIDEITIDCNSGISLITASTDDKNLIADINWNSDQNFTVTNDLYTIEVDSSGYYFIKLTGINGCENQDSIKVNSWDKFSFDVMMQSSCGDNNSGSLNVSNIIGQNGPFMFSLNGINYQSDNLFEKLGPGNYTVYVRNIDSCIISRDINIDKYELPQWTYTTKASCDDISTGNIIVSLVNGATPVEYFLDDTIMNLDGLFDNLAGESEYVLKIVDNNGCEIFDTIFIPEVENFNTNALEIVNYCNENTLVLEALEDDNLSTVKYDWGSEKDTLRTKVIRALPSIFEVNITNACKSITKIFEVAPLSINADTVAFIPLAFTPNNDGENDEFGPIFRVNEDQIISYEMRVYNRWGELVYTTSRAGRDWNGRFNNEDAIPGVYIYIVNFKFDNCKLGLESKSFTGNVTLIR